MFLDFVHNLGVEFNMDTTWPLLEMGEYFLAPVRTQYMLNEMNMFTSLL